MRQLSLYAPLCRVCLFAGQLKQVTSSYAPPSQVLVLTHQAKPWLVCWMDGAASGCIAAGPMQLLTRRRLLLLLLLLLMDLHTATACASHNAVVKRPVHNHVHAHHRQQQLLHARASDKLHCTRATGATKAMLYGAACCLGALYASLNCLHLAGGHFVYHPRCVA